MGFFTKWFNMSFDVEKMLEEWGQSVLMFTFKNMDDVQSRSHYRGIKTMSQAMKIWGRVAEAELREVNSTDYDICR